MGIVARGLVGMVLVSLAAAPRGAAADPPGGLKIGMPQNMFKDVPPAMANALTKPFRMLFDRTTGFTGDVDVLPDAAAVAAKLRDKKLDLAVFHGFEFARLKAAHPEFRPLVVPVPTGRTLHACVVVAADSKYAALADLGPAAIAVPRGIKAHCTEYLDHARRGLRADIAKPLAQPTRTTEDVLNAVADGTSIAALVDEAALKGYANLQPGLAKRLRVLCQSEAFPVSVVVYRVGAVDDAGTDRIRRGLIAANQTPQGKPLMMLWNLTGFEDVPADYDAQLDRVNKAYPPVK